MLSDEQIRALPAEVRGERWRIIKELMTARLAVASRASVEERERRLRMAREEHEASCRALEQALLARS